MGAYLKSREFRFIYHTVEHYRDGNDLFLIVSKDSTDFHRQFSFKSKNGNTIFMNISLMKDELGNIQAPNWSNYLRRYYPDYLQEYKDYQKGFNSRMKAVFNNTKRL